MRLVAERTGVAAARLELLSGFPPKRLDVSSHDAVAAVTLGLRSGDSLLAVEASGGAASEAPAGGAGGAAAPPAPSAAAAAAPPTSGAALDSVCFADGSGFALQRRIMASDNSCLFNAVAYVVSQSRSSAPELRRAIADAVAADAEEFSEAFLGKPNAEYCAWIQEKDSWGGAIELSVLSKRRVASLRLCSCARARLMRARVWQVRKGDLRVRHPDDARGPLRTGTLWVERAPRIAFRGARCALHALMQCLAPQGDWPDRVFVLYDGIHYDALAVTVFADAPPELDVTVHPVDAPNAAAVDEAVARLVSAAHAARAFTDTQVRA